MVRGVVNFYRALDVGLPNRQIRIKKCDQVREARVEFEGSPDDTLEITSGSWHSIPRKTLIDVGVKEEENRGHRQELVPQIESVALRVEKAWEKPHHVRCVSVQQDFGSALQCVEVTGTDVEGFALRSGQPRSGRFHESRKTHFSDEVVWIEGRRNIVGNRGRDGSGGVIKVVRGVTCLCDQTVHLSGYR